MLVQRRHDSLWLFTQNDHGLLSGRLAYEWWGLDDEPSPLPFELILATSIHDTAWIRADSEPTWNPDTGRPFDSLDLPLERRLPMYWEGLEILAGIDPYTALLASKHYATLGGMVTVEEFQERESQRQTSLEGALGLSKRAMATVESQLSYLRMFDLLSYHLCLAAPSGSEELPSWLSSQEIGKTPAGTEFTIAWRDDNRVVVTPFPFRQLFHIELPYRELAGARFDSQEELSKAWANAELQYWPVEIS